MRLQTSPSSIKISASIANRHTGKGKPSGVLHMGIPLNKRQSELLGMLPKRGSSVIVKKTNVSMTDLAAITAYTNREFAMFTKRGKRLIIRGGVDEVPVNTTYAEQLNREGYRWSGHTHPETDELFMVSPEDKAILRCFDQEFSSIYNPKGNFRVYGKN